MTEIARDVTIYAKGIKEPFNRRFVIWARHYIEVFSDKRLALHTCDDLDEYLSTLGGNGSWQGWRGRTEFR